MKLSKAVLILGVIMGISPFFCGKVLADVPFEDNFDSYATGTLDGQGGWWSDSYSCNVVDSGQYDGERGVKCVGNYAENKRHKTSYSTTSGAWEFMLKSPNCSGDPNAMGNSFIEVGYHGWDNPYFRGFSFHPVSVNGTSYCRVQWEESWPWKEIEWKDLPFEFFDNYKKIVFRWDEEGGHNLWITLGDEPEEKSPITDGVDGGSIKAFHFFASLAGGHEMYLDELKEYTPPPTGTTATIEPETPTCGYSHSFDYSNITLSGKVKIGKNSPNIYNQFGVYFEDANNPLSEKSQWHFFEFPTSSASDIVEYNYTTSLLSPTSTSYNIEYFLEGYNASTGKRVFEHLSCGTITPLLGVDIQDLQQYSTYTTSSWQMNCDGLSGAEWWLCRLSNMIEGIFLPSQSKVSELRANIDLLKQKFPQNYINAFSNFLSSLRSGINNASTTGLNFKVWGQSGTANFNFWNRDFTMLGTTQTISNIFRGFAYFASLLIFVLWSLNFGKRIFK